MIDQSIFITKAKTASQLTKDTRFFCDFWFRRTQRVMLARYVRYRQPYYVSLTVREVLVVNGIVWTNASQKTVEKTDEHKDSVKKAVKH